ncbi:MAG: UDP-N-acetylmuramate dehydrogenase [Acidimicrobiales bacterium]
MSSELKEVERALGDIARSEVAIGPFTTYRVGGRAALFVEPDTGAHLERLVAALAGRSVGVLVLGRGSNMLVSDSGWPGIAVRLGAGFSRVESEESLLVAGGAAAYPIVARRCAALGLSGLEWAVGIPGSVGGGVRMNAGGHGSETSEHLAACRIVDLGKGSDTWRRACELDLSYRHSAISRTEIVLEATFTLAMADRDEVSARIAEIVAWRRANQPGGQNAGSVFTNPPGDSAGRLIEAAGLKGLRMGSAAVSDKHANFVQADPAGSAGDVARLVERVQKEVAHRLGVELSVELEMVGFTRAT